MPRALAAAFAFHVVALITVCLPSDPAHVPERLFEAASVTPEHPRTRVGFHTLAPTSRKDCFEESLDPTHAVTIGPFFDK